MHPAGTGAPPEHTRHRFLLLDAMRGLAAIAVVLYHGHELSGVQPAPHGYLAVDFFFFLSGFVIQYAYGKQLDQGMPLGTFLKLRIARLYPLYFLSLLPGLILFATSASFRDEVSPRHHYFAAAGAQFLFLPIPAALGINFAFNPAAWSLCQELLSNVLHAAFLRRRSILTLLLCCAPFALLDIFLAHRHGTFDIGWDGLDTFRCLPRAFFPYIAGIALERWWSHKPRHFHIPAIPCALVLIALLFLPQPIHNKFLLDAAIVVVAFPLLIALSTGTETTGWLQSPAVLLGLLSYPLYVVHRPILLVMQQRFHAPSWHNPAPASLLGFALFLVLAILLALALELLYDRPIRKYLRHRL